MTITNLFQKVQIILERQANTSEIATLDYVCWKRNNRGSFMPIFICMCLSEQAWLVHPSWMLAINWPVWAD